jgi:acetoin utilization deacetylase AcuC-like enzyme
MPTLLYSHTACLGHDPGPYHPESPVRLRAVLEALSAEEFALLDRREAPRGEIDDIARVHPRETIEQVLEAVPARGHVGIDADTIISPGSGEAALRAVGAVCAAVDAVMAGEGRNAFCAIRPPGHHAEPTRPMGFCLFNNVAIGALRARQVHGCERVAVVDFDVHHGNGTQAMFAADAGLFYASTHQYPLYPGTGASEETGVGNILNVPLAPGSGTAAFQRAFNELILPALEEFRPEFLFVSAGFDAHRRDPLANLDLVEADYDWVTRRLAHVAARHCRQRLISVLEGGYDLAALAGSAAAHVRALMAA